MGSPVTGWQIVTKDPDRLAEFYTQMFGWKINADNALGARMVETGGDDGIRGGIWPAPPQAHGFVQLFIEVEDVAAAVSRARQLGASVIIPPRKLPEGGELAILHDPEGIPFGVKHSEGA